MIVHGIYYKKIFKDVPEVFKSYSLLLKRSDKTILGQGFGLNEKSLLEMLVLLEILLEMLWHLSKYCPIFWSGLQFLLIGISAGNWSIIMEYSSFRDISKNKSWVLWIFVLRIKGRSLDYVLWLGMVKSALMLLSRIYLRRLSNSSRDNS